ncbi:prephenate dehydrogenase [Rhodococcus sp. ARC_M6]|uniref:prephenate dehydrogenase n=1 Tax=Rhodococcus sp. ARC_M6 TaxID=2928852 RepID=UPI001FB39808|nr:prephenate dehydrogenase [Rhodococcus sp. ARC_M6]MCJ0905043.1 prephenate dehydrogenase [Rhodococcus sp. ARC_M6]
MSPVGCDDVIVVGGAGAVGSMLVDLMRRDGRPVTILDPADPDSPLRGDVTGPDDILLRALTSADIVILAVPETVALASLPTLVRAVRPDALIVDTLSVKSRMSVAVENSGRTGEFLGVNPMFRPSLGPAGRPIIAVPYIDGPRGTDLVESLRTWGAIVSVMDPNRHDRLAAATQALTHASVLAFGLALGELGVSAEEVADVETPPHRTLSALLARIVNGEPEVYWDVQSGNPYAETARKALITACVRLDSATADLENFSDVVKSASEGLGSRSEELDTLCRRVFEEIGSRK